MLQKSNVATHITGTSTLRLLGTGTIVAPLHHITEPPGTHSLSVVDIQALACGVQQCHSRFCVSEADLGLRAIFPYPLEKLG
jgi:hypothetical protein